MCTHYMYMVKFPVFFILKEKENMAVSVFYNIMQPYL